MELGATEGTFGATLAATSDDPALATVSLMRPGATTHTSDNEQRLVDLPFTAAGAGALTLQLPAGPELAPPGWYLVFAVNAAGVPSHGSWLHLS